MFNYNNACPSWKWLCYTTVSRRCEGRAHADLLDVVGTFRDFFFFQHQ